MRKPISKARRNSLIIKAGAAILNGVSLISVAGFSPAKSVNSNKSFSLVFLTIKSFSGLAAFSRPSMISILSSIIGLMPSVHERSRVGVITKKVINRASETKTILGGVALVAKALRVMEKTTLMRMNEVVITRMDGAKDRTVIIIKTLKIRAAAEPSGVSATLRDRLCDKAFSGKHPAKIRARAAIKSLCFIVVCLLLF